MADLHGKFQWYELMTPDPEAAKAFYAHVVGWGSQDVPMPEMRYALFTAGDTPVAGVMEMPAEAKQPGAPPAWWMGYVGVDDVDRTVAHAKRLGGTECVPPTDIPGIGHFAVIGDPQSARFGLLKWLDPSRMAPDGMGKLAHTGWHELLASDWTKALEFYGALFGWTKAEAIDMGEMGTYQLFAAGEAPIGGMFNKPPPVPVPFWQYYFTVGAIDAAAARVTERGGQIAMGPMEVPGGKWILNCVDPQGAMFALLGDAPAG